jgi:hypothetical protein
MFAEHQNTFSVRRWFLERSVRRLPLLETIVPVAASTLAANDSTLHEESSLSALVASIGFDAADIFAAMEFRSTTLTGH